jgi:zinc resistance-associated protein
MKRNNKYILALFATAALAFGSGAALAGPHWGNGNGMGGQGYNALTPEQQTTVQKLHDDYYAQTSALRQQLMSKRYEYNALLTTSSPDSTKIEAVANEMATLTQQLDQQRVKFDVALAQSGVPRGAGMGYGGCGGGMGMHRGGGHMGMGRW